MYGQEDTLLPILQNAKQTKKVSTFDIAQAVTSHPDTFYEFLIDNNIASVNDILRHNCGFSKLPFKPNRAAIEATIKGLIDSKNTAKLRMISDNFVYNPMAPNYTTHPDVQTLLGAGPADIAVKGTNPATGAKHGNYDGQLHGGHQNLGPNPKYTPTKLLYNP